MYQIQSLSIWYRKVYPNWHFQPLSAALLCGASRCALRLLEYPRALASGHMQRTVSYLADFGTGQFRETLDMVMDALGTSPEEFVEPENWGDTDSRRYRTCLWKHDFYSRDESGTRRDYTPTLLRWLWSKRDFSVAAELPRERLSRALPELIHAEGRSTYVKYKQLEKLQARHGITLTLDRDAILPGTCWYALLRALDHAEAGPPPEGRLSAAAALLLRAMLLEPPLRNQWSYLSMGEEPGLDPMYEIIHSERAVRLLLEEDSKLVQQFLDELGKEHPEHNSEILSLSMELMVPFRFELRFRRD